MKKEINSLFKSKKEYAFGPNIARIIYKYFGETTNEYQEIQNKIITFFQIEEELFEWIDSFTNKHGKYFYRQIRNGIQSLKKSNFLIKENEKYYATTKLKLLDTTEIEIKMNQFWKEAKKLFNKNKNQYLRSFNNKILWEIRKYQFKDEISREEIEEEPIIIDLRKEFEKKINFEKNNLLNFPNTYLNQQYINYDFQLPEKTHILPIHILYKQKKLKEIASPFNGLFLDPKTHQLLEDNKIGFDRFYNFIDVKTKEVYASINHKILTPERKRFIDQHRKLFPIK